MIVKPRMRGFISTTAHPLGCARGVDHQIDVIRGRGPIAGGPGNVLVVGSSMGYGLASRITAAFGCRAATVGVMYERPAVGVRTATAGWYNTAAFHRDAEEDGLYAATFNEDAFSEETKARVIEVVLRDLGALDLVVYSLAAPRRALPTGEVAKSTLRPIGEPYRNKTIDLTYGKISTVELPPVESEAEIEDTVKVMGGEDWARWIEVLGEAGALAADVVTVAYSYIGPELTYPLYRQGTIGRAKDHLEATARRLDEGLVGRGGRALVSVNKAVVTQSSSAIPVVPLYISLLFRVMKEQGLHEGCIEQTERLFRNRLYAPGDIPVDDVGRIRLDDLEMRSEVQLEVARRWKEVANENVTELADLDGYHSDFLELFGFDWDDVDYESEVDIDVPLRTA